MANVSFNFRKALEDLTYLQSLDGFAESLFQKMVAKMKEYKIQVVDIHEIYICLISDRSFSSSKNSCKIHVTYTEKGGDYKNRICSIDNVMSDSSDKIFELIENKLKYEQFDYTDITKQSQEKDPNIIRMIKIKI